MSVTANSHTPALGLRSDAAAFGPPAEGDGDDGSVPVAVLREAEKAVGRTPGGIRPTAHGQRDLRQS
ncbi:hypothetical protein [Streptomyces sp. Ju416(a)]|uniref:hypothetical protein n=1 Tax=Streptomyces sp. Ju416(a) TaxID=3446591 RepID=UPI00403D62D3